MEHGKNPGVVMIARLRLILFTCIAIALLAGCAGTPKQQTVAGKGHTTPKSHSKPPGSNKHSPIYQRLDKQYSRWKGTPYELGGLNKNGIDCSGFVHVTFREAFGMQLPRTTEDLAESGRHIDKHKLVVGDLVFFKTGFGKHHVGIYMGNQQFIHASTSRGVMKSSLRNPYWSQHYWKSTRILTN
ncbi:NlpC/P60 family protein [Kaarinaea lacus]